MQLDDRKIELLITTHKIKLGLFDAMTLYDPAIPDDLKVLKILSDIVTRTEFHQQELWGFAEDKNYHLFWQMPHCTCDKAENERRWRILHEDYFAYPGPSHADDCPYHGKVKSRYFVPGTVVARQSEDASCAVDQASHREPD